MLLTLTISFPFKFPLKWSLPCSGHVHQLTIHPNKVDFFPHLFSLQAALLAAVTVHLVLHIIIYSHTQCPVVVTSYIHTLEREREREREKERERKKE